MQGKMVLNARLNAAKCEARCINIHILEINKSYSMC